MLESAKFIYEIVSDPLHVTIFISLLFTPLFLINLLFIIEVVAGLRRRSAAGVSSTAISVAIVMPAHDEEAVIAKTLERLDFVAGSAFQILVVADNCSDDTAAIARQYNVRVVERNDSVRKGKGYALAFARDALRSDPPAAVVVLDADCRVDQASLHALAQACQRTKMPCQAVYLLEPRPSASPMVQISTFAFLLKNLVRQRGLQRLTGGVHLTGSGMCLPWQHFESADLATSNIVEDVRLGLELAQLGARPQFVEDAIVWSEPSDAAGTLTQRQRWEGGLLATASGTAPQAILRAMKRLDLQAVMTGFDLLIPPLAMLALLNAAAFLVTTAVAAMGWSAWGPTVALAFVGSMVGLAILAVWWREGRQFLTPRTLLRLPLYVLWKVPMYFALASRGAPSEWVRTDRPTRTDQEG